MRTVKAIQFRYVVSDELASLFEDFRLMCNDAIRIALKEKPRSRTGECGALPAGRAEIGT